MANGVAVLALRRSCWVCVGRCELIRSLHVQWRDARGALPIWVRGVGRRMRDRGMG